MALRPTFMGFETAKTSIFYNQKGLDITGNNLANASTAGYTRQRVDAGSLYVNSNRNRIAINQVGIAGQGVDTQGVSQTRDSFLDKCFREQYATASYHAQASATLQNIQTALVDAGDVTDEDGLLGALQKIYESIQDYAADPTTGTEANIVKSAFTSMTQILKQIDLNLTQVAEEETFSLSKNVDRVNEILEQITDINDQIAKSAVNLMDPDNSYFQPNELLDQRNLLVDELSGYVDLRLTEYNDGTCDISVGDVKAVEAETGKIARVRLQENDNHTVSLKWLTTGDNIRLTGGSLLAQQQYISGRGSNIQSNTETPEQGILYYRDCINTFAQALTQIANNTIPQTTTDILGNTVLLNSKYAHSKTQLTNKIASGSVPPPNGTEKMTSASVVMKVNGTTYKYTRPADTSGSATTDFSLSTAVDDYNAWLKTQFGMDAGGNANISYNIATGQLDILNGAQVSFNQTVSGSTKQNNLALALGLAEKSNVATNSTTFAELGMNDMATELGLLPTDTVGTLSGQTITVGGNTFTIDFSQDDGKFRITGEVGDYEFNDGSTQADLLKNIFGSPIRIGDGTITYKKLLGAKIEGSTDNDSTVNASNIAVSDEWEKNGADYFIFDPDQNIAKYAQQLSTQLTNQDFTFSSFGEKFTGTFEEYVTNYSGKIGSDISYQAGRNETCSKIADTYLDQRDSISGVVENEETANMLQFQRAFQAASRVMTTMDDFLDKIINSMGRVGL